MGPTVTPCGHHHCGAQGTHNHWVWQSAPSALHSFRPMNDRHFLFKNEIPSKTRATKHETRNSHTGLHESFINHDLFANSGFLKNILSLRDSTTDTFWAESACTVRLTSTDEAKSGGWPRDPPESGSRPNRPCGIDWGGSFCRKEAEGSVLDCSYYLTKRVPTNFGDSLKICDHSFLFVSEYNIKGTVNLLTKIMSQWHNCFTYGHNQ